MPQGNHNDDAFGRVARLAAQGEARFEAEMQRARDDPDEVLELANFAITAQVRANDLQRQELCIVKPGRQVLVKIGHENARALAQQLTENADWADAKATQDEGLEASGS
jgi:hypothetical protein